MEVIAHISYIKPLWWKLQWNPSHKTQMKIYRMTKKNKHKTKRNCHKNLLSKIPLQFLRLSYVCVWSTAVASLSSSLFCSLKKSSSEVIKLKTKICCCCVWEVKLSQEGEMRTQMEIQVLVCKKLFFPKETLMEMGIVLWVILLLFHYDLILLIAIAIPCGFLY